MQKLLTCIGLATRISQYSRKDIALMALIALGLIIFQVAVAISFLPHAFVHLAWLSGGLAIASMLLLGIRIWPAIFFGVLAGSLLINNGSAGALVAATGLTVSSAFAVWILGLVVPNFDLHVRRQRDLWHLLFVCLIQSFLAAAIFISPGLLAGPITIALHTAGFLDLSISGFIGAAILAPLVLMLATRGGDNFMLVQRPHEFTFFMLASILVNWIVWVPWQAGFHSTTGTWFLAPVFIWAVARMGQRGTAILVLLTYGFAVGTDHDSGFALLGHVTNDWDINMFGVMLTLCSHFAAAIFNEQLLAENAVLEGKRRLRLGQLYGGVGTWEADIVNGRQYWSDYVVQHLGFPRIENPTWEDFISIVVPEDRAMVNEAVRAHLEHGTKYDIRYRIADGYGRVRTLRSAGQVERDDDGRPVLMRGIVQDISDLIYLEESLHASEQRYHALFQATGDAIIIVDFNGYIEDVNRSGEKLLGYRRGEMIGRHVSMMHPREQMQKVQWSFMQITTQGIADAIETQVLQKNGKVITVEVRPTIMEIDGRQLLQGIFIDLTERKRLEEQRRAEEASHRNALIREVHHRIKNNLQGIIGVLRQFVGKHPEVADPINEAISQVQSIAVIHGLQGRTARDKVRVCELTSTIASGIGAIWQCPLRLDIPPAWTPCTIMEKEAVPMALVINELLSNAVKHSNGGEIDIRIRHEPRPDMIELTISNVGRMDNPRTENTMVSNSGIDLVQTLLPRVGANLSWKQEGNMVVTKLVLEPPIIMMDEGEYAVYEL